MIRDPRTWGLWFMALVCFEQAYSYSPLTDAPDHLPYGLDALARVMPIGIYALMWFLALLGCVRNSLHASRTWQWIVFPCFPALLWGIAYIAGWIASGTTGLDWRGSVIYFVISGAICCFGLVKPIEPKADPDV